MDYQQNNFCSLTRNGLPTLLSVVSGKDRMKIRSDHGKSFMHK